MTVLPYLLKVEVDMEKAVAMAVTEARVVLATAVVVGHTVAEKAAAEKAAAEGWEAEGWVALAELAATAAM